MVRIFFDIETTGLSIYTCTPIQVSALALDEKWSELGRITYYVRFDHPEVTLDPIITQITGITDAMLIAHGVPTGVAVSKWTSFLRSFPPAHLLGYNCLSFDYPMIINWIDRFSIERFKFPPIRRITDVMHEVSAHFNTSRWMKLKDAAIALGIEFDEKKLHSAEFDVELTAKVWRKMNEKDKG